jgi:hypothetical protein
MDNFVEFLDARGRAAGCAERGFSQPGTVDASVGIQDFAAEAADDFVIDCLAGPTELWHGIGLNQMASLTNISPTTDLPLAIPPVRPSFSNGCSRM